MKTIDELRETPNLIIQRTGMDGGCGEVRYGRLSASVIWSYDCGWEHVSVSPYKRGYTPSWDEMCKLKDMFFHDEEVVVQYHPAKSEYVNQMPNCLHLWRSTRETMPTPPSIMVGLRPGQTAASIMEEIRKLYE